MKNLLVIFLAAISLNSFGTELFMNFQRFSDDSLVAKNQSFKLDIGNLKEKQAISCNFHFSDEEYPGFFEVVLGLESGIYFQSVSMGKEGEETASTAVSRNFKEMRDSIAITDGYVYSEFSVGAKETFEVYNDLMRAFEEDVIEISKAKTLEFGEQEVLVFGEKYSVYCELEEEF